MSDACNSRRQRLPPRAVPRRLVPPHLEPLRLVPARLLPPRVALRADSLALDQPVSRAVLA